MLTYLGPELKKPQLAKAVKQKSLLESTPFIFKKWKPIPIVTKCIAQLNEMYGFLRYKRKHRTQQMNGNAVFALFNMVIKCSKPAQRC